ncbi:MAG TPA: hypothetical protein VHB21_02055 [Minicystis sp.]|nr:hypothetical protein [Minicystis sp.]
MLRAHAIALGLAALATGCVAPYTVKRQVRPNPFPGQASFALLPLDFTTAEVQVDALPETPWTAKEKRQFEAAKVRMNVAFTREVLADLTRAGIRIAPAGSPTASDARFVIQPRVVEITPGDFSGMGKPSSHVRVNVAIATRGGQVLDVVEVEHGTLGDPLAGDTEARLAIDGSFVGERLAGYVHERVVPGSELE